MSKLIILLLLIVGLGAGLYLVQHPQIFKPKAYCPEEDIACTDHTTESVPKPYELEKGFAIDLSHPEKIPSQKVFNLLRPNWIRSVYFQEHGIPASIPGNVKILIVFNNQVTPALELVTPRTGTNFTHSWDTYQPRTDFELWKTFTDKHFIPALNTFLESNQRVDAIQIWNEEDFCGGGTGICVPPEAYAYMLKKSSEAVKISERDIKIIAGGLVSQKFEYLEFMKKEIPNIFNLIHAVAIHPYGLSPDGWCQYYNDTEANRRDHPDRVVNGTTRVNEDTCFGHDLPFGEGQTVVDVINKYKSATGLPVWITEIGQTEDPEEWQSEYFKRVFNAFSKALVPMAIWYSWSDKMAGTLEANDPNRPKFGLVDYEDSIKAVGIEFKHF